MLNFITCYLNFDWKYKATSHLEVLHVAIEQAPSLPRNYAEHSTNKTSLHLKESGELKDYHVGQGII